jgi:uncharacterized protein (TIGR02246 family)
MRRHLALLILTTGMLAACSPAPAPPPPPPPDTTAADTAAINKIRDAYSAAWKAGDAERLGSLVSTDVVFYPTNAPAVTGRDAFVADQKKQFADATPNDFAIKSEEMRLAGGWAFDRGTVDISLTPKAKGAKMMTFQSRYIVVLQRQGDGSWLLTRGIDNTPVPMPPPPPAKR